MERKAHSTWNTSETKREKCWFTKKRNLLMLLSLDRCSSLEVNTKVCGLNIAYNEKGFWFISSSSPHTMFKLKVVKWQMQRQKAILSKVTQRDHINWTVVHSNVSVKMFLSLGHTSDHYLLNFLYNIWIRASPKMQMEEKESLIDRASIRKKKHLYRFSLVPCTLCPCSHENKY